MAILTRGYCPDLELSVEELGAIQYALRIAAKHTISNEIKRELATLYNKLTSQPMLNEYSGDL